MGRRFSVVVHETPDPAGRHLDVFFEMETALFSLKTAAIAEPYAAFDALRQADHRKRYLDYEGPISGGRGSVSLWDRGAMRGEVCEDGAFELELFGERLRGRYRVEPSGAGYRVLRVS